jgi:hypothetical protein
MQLMSCFRLVPFDISDDNEVFFSMFLSPVSLSLDLEWGLPLLVEWSI